MKHLLLIPHWILPFLPEKWQSKQIHLRWDLKTDEEILSAQESALEWIKLYQGVFKDINSLEKIAEDCTIKYNLYILPQVIKRRLSHKPLKRLKCLIE